MNTRKREKSGRERKRAFESRRRISGKRRWLAGVMAALLLLAFSMPEWYAQEQKPAISDTAEQMELPEQITEAMTDEKNTVELATEAVSEKEKTDDPAGEDDGQVDDMPDASAQEISASITENSTEPALQMTEYERLEEDTAAEQTSGETELLGRDVRDEAETEASSERNAAYKVYFEENTRFSILPERAQAEYSPGEKVAFHIETLTEEPAISVEAYACEETGQESLEIEAAEDAGEADPEKEPETEVLKTAARQEVHYEAETETYWFSMPESEVVVLVRPETEEAEDELLLGKAAGQEDEEDAVPDKFTLICSQYPDYTHAPSSMQSYSLKLAMTSRKKVVFYEEDGTKTTRVAYCIQPAADSPGSGDTYDKDQAIELDSKTAKNKQMTKALYYLYGGPAWGKEVEYSDGSGSVNLKELLNNDGKDCNTNDEYYCITHFVLSYLYQGADGKWNYMYTTEPVSGVLNDHGTAVVKKIADEISRLPLPATELSKDQVTASYHSEQGVSVSQTIRYKTNAENTGKISLPDGITLVNETTGERFTGRAVLSGGDKFHLEASPGVTGEKEYTVKTTYATDFTAMVLVKGGNHQDIGFSYYSGDKSLEFEVEWPKNGKISLQKADAETKTSASYNDRYALAQAVYGVYYDAGCAKKAKELITNAKGYVEAALPLGTYYVKEIAAPLGYQLNPQVYKAEVRNAGGAVTVEAEDIPIKKKIRIRKRDAQTGEAKPQNSQASFAGAEYTIYRDAGCTDAVEVLVTDASGGAESRELRLADYFVRETKAPTGYLPDTTIHKVEMTQANAAAVYEIISSEEMIRGSLALMKYLDDNMEESVLQDLYDAGTLENIRFKLVHEDANVAPVTISTDRYGYAATQRKELVYGTWYLSEDSETTPEGYQGIKNVKLEITQNDAEQVYVVTNKPYEAYLCIQKKDRDSGTLISRNPAKFQILDSHGEPVKMPTFDGYTDVFSTNELGEIHLTRSLKGGRYTLVEIQAPSGYEPAEPIAFEIGENAVFQEPLFLECADAPKKGTVSITKIDKNTGEHCGPGFVFQVKVRETILDGNGEVRREFLDGEEKQLIAGTVVDTITTNEDGVAKSRDLYLGDYQIQELSPGEYYANNSEIYEAVLSENSDGQYNEPIVADLEVEDERTAVVLTKQDSIQNIVMSGVKFTLREKAQEGRTPDADQNAVTDENGRLQFKNLKHSTVYCLQETETLPGYVADGTVYEISVDENGYIDGQAVYEMKLTNTPNVVEISKQDITGGGELPGAALTLNDENGNELARWISGNEPHRITGLPAGRYTLTEITAPKGYEVAETILFELTDSLEVQKVVMYDKPSEEKSETETQIQTEPGKDPTPKIPLTEKQPPTSSSTVTSRSPKTGDDAPVEIFFLLAVCSLVAIIAYFKNRYFCSDPAEHS